MRPFLALLIGLAPVLASCGSDTSSTGASSSSSSSSSGGGSACVDDGVCSLAEQGSADPCACDDCLATALCADACTPDGACTLADACTCQDCWNDLNCRGTCDHDGTCDRFVEGCDCDDCKTDAACAGFGGDAGAPGM